MKKDINVLKIKAEQILGFCGAEKSNYGEWNSLSKYQKAFLSDFASAVLEYIGEAHNGKLPLDYPNEE